MRGVVVVLFAAVAALSGCGRGAPTAAPTDPPGPGPGPDKDRLQGVWAVESADSGDPQADLRELQRLNLDITKMRFQFRGDRVDRGYEGKFSPEVSFVLDESANPKVMRVTHLQSDGTPYTRPAGSKIQAHPHEWLYKFDGDVLVLAKPRAGIFNEKAPPRPTDFTPKPPSSPDGVNVLRLKKAPEPVTEPAPRPVTPTGTRK